MKYDPTCKVLPEHNLPHLDLEEIMLEDLLLSDHGDVIIGDRSALPGFSRTEL